MFSQVSSKFLAMCNILLYSVSFKASLILMAFSYLKSVAYIQDGILIKEL